MRDEKIMGAIAGLGCLITAVAHLTWIAVVAAVVILVWKVLT